MVDTDYNDYNDYRDSDLDLGQQTLVDTSRHQQTDSDLDATLYSEDKIDKQDLSTGR